MQLQINYILERGIVMKKLLSGIMSLTILFSGFSLAGTVNASTIEYNSEKNISEITDQPPVNQDSLNYFNDEVLKDISDYPSPLLEDGSGEGAYELGFLTLHGLLFADTSAWHQSVYLFPAENLVVHFKTHGKEVNADTAKSYLNKSIEFRRTAKKGVQGKPVSGYVQGVKRYTKNGRYIDLAPNDKIISFGSVN